MTEPLFVISHFRVREGKTEEFKEYYERILRIVEANEPRIIGFHGFMNDAGTEVTSIQFHPDTESTEHHMRVLRDNWDEAFNEYAQLVQQTSVELCGRPPKSALEMKLQPGATQTIRSSHVGGLTRAVSS